MMKTRIGSTLAATKPLVMKAVKVLATGAISAIELVPVIIFAASRGAENCG